jgi:hypothetical protein
MPRVVRQCIRDSSSPVKPVDDEACLGEQKAVGSMQAAEVSRRSRKSCTRQESQAAAEGLSPACDGR